MEEFRTFEKRKIMDWKTITLFISSTFNDMHDERDFIKRHIVSRLNDTLEPYRISVQVTPSACMCRLRKATRNAFRCLKAS